MKHSLKIARQIKHRAPMVRSIKCFLIIRRTSRQRLYGLLTLVFRRFRNGVFQQISRSYTPLYRLGTSIYIQNIKESKPGRLLRSGSVFENPGRNHINRNLVLHRSYVDVRNNFRPNLLNQTNWFLEPTIQTREYKSLKKYYASTASMMLTKSSNNSVDYRKTFQPIFNAITRFYLSEIAVTNRSLTPYRGSKPGASRLGGKVKTLKYSVKLIKKSSSEPDIESLYIENNVRKRKKGTTEYLRYSYPRTLVRDQIMSAEVDRPLRRKQTVYTTELAYPKKPQPTFAQNPRRSNKGTEIGNPKIDIDRLTEDVMRKINTKIRIERERRGLL